jgi:hypothetical protein
MRIEITAKMPTQATSACPAIYLSNATEQYARYAETGVISMFEMIPSSSLSQSMVQFVPTTLLPDNSYQTRLQWGRHDAYNLSFDFANDNNISLSQFNVYSVEYSNLLRDGAYVRFDRRADNDVDEVIYGPTIFGDQWQSLDVRVCVGQYHADGNRCSFLAPFDAAMNIYLQLATGDQCWQGGDIVDGDNVEMEISKIVVSAMYFDECPDRFESSSTPHPYTVDLTQSEAS